MKSLQRYKILTGLSIIIAACAADQTISFPAAPIWTERPAPPHSVRVNPKDDLKYVRIPPGGFMMGCSPGDNDCFDPEKPLHRVNITKDFWIGQTEVTVAAYKHFAQSAGKAMPPAPDFDADWSKLELPISNVPWDDAEAYCVWAGGRLPTEAEWEYAARGGTSVARYGAVDNIAWYNGNSMAQAHPVAQKLANGFGLYDMLGNVWEWVGDWYAQDYYQNSPADNPAGPALGSLHVLRGGSWGGLEKFARVSVRIRGFSGGTKGFNGFRCGGKIFRQ